MFCHDPEVRMREISSGTTRADSKKISLQSRRRAQSLYKNQAYLRISAKSAENINLRTFDNQFCSKKKKLIPIFDFDGVLANVSEDLLYRATVESDEVNILKKAACYFGIDADFYDAKYLRHLVYQYFALDEDIPISIGPLLGLAKDLTSAKRPFFVLTARSGVAAVQRTLNFFRDHDLAPQEIFCVGRVAKGRQLRMLSNQADSDTQFIFFEDNPRHNLNSSRLSVGNVYSILVEWESFDQKVEKCAFIEKLRERFAENRVHAA